MNISKQRSAGFTLLELVMVILIIGIIAVTLMPSWTGSSISVENEVRHVLDDIRYAQAMSIASGQRYRFVKLSATTYSVYNEAGTVVTMPNGATITTLTNNVSFGAFGNLPNSLIAFDSLGAPYTTSAYPGTALAATATIPLSLNGNTHTISISPQTGYGSL